MQMFNKEISGIVDQLFDQQYEQNAPFLWFSIFCYFNKYHEPS